MDYWILDRILDVYKPRALMVETNVRFEPDESYAIKYMPGWTWNGSAWYGASPLAFKNMLNRHGYSPVHIHIDDMLAVRNDVLDGHGLEPAEWSVIYPASNKPLYNDHTGGGYFQNDMPTEEWSEV